MGHQNTAEADEIELLSAMTKRMEGHTICALGDAAAQPIQVGARGRGRERLQALTTGVWWGRGRAVCEGPGAGSLPHSNSDTSPPSPPPLSCPPHPRTGRASSATSARCSRRASAPRRPRRRQRPCDAAAGRARRYGKGGDSCAARRGAARRGAAQRARPRRALLFPPSSPCPCEPRPAAAARPVAAAARHAPELMYVCKCGARRPHPLPRMRLPAGPRVSVLCHMVCCLWLVVGGLGPPLHAPCGTPLGVPPASPGRRMAARGLHTEAGAAATDG
jgi:hypothetical protein